MDRRKLLATTGTTLALPLVGCLQETSTLGGNRTDIGEGDTSENGKENGTEETNEDRKYEECHLISIDYEWLPEDIQKEVDVVFNKGQYETDQLLFAEAINPDQSYLVHNDTPYNPAIETVNGKQVLELHEDEVVRAPEPRVLHIQNKDTRDHEIQLEMTNDETVLDEFVTVQPDDEIEVETTERFGTYDLTARTLTGHGEEDSFDFTVRDSSFEGYIEVNREEIWISQSVAEIVPCPWDETHFGAQD
jgi:hypothetical protein